MRLRAVRKIGHDSGRNGEHLMLQPAEATDKTPGRLKWRKLETISEVRLAMATVVKKCFDKKLDPDYANACTNGLRALAKVLHDSELERRMREIEERLRASAQ